MYQLLIDIKLDVAIKKTETLYLEIYIFVYINIIKISFM